MAAPPSTASPASWNPAVPPPPVTGAAVGTNEVNEGLGDGLDDGVGDGVGLSPLDAAGLCEVFGLSEVPPLAVLVAELVTEEETDADPVTVGENTDGGEEVPPDVQAESAKKATTVMRPQPTAVSLARCAVHAMAVRAFIEPPHALGNDHFPVASRRNRRRNGKRVAAFGR